MEIDHITDEQLAQDAAKAAEGHEAQLKAEQEARDKRQRSRRLRKRQRPLRRRVTINIK